MKPRVALEKCSPQVALAAPSLHGGANFLSSYPLTEAGRRPMLWTAAGISAEQQSRHYARGFPAGRPEDTGLRRRNRFRRWDREYRRRRPQGNGCTAHSDPLRQFFCPASPTRTIQPETLQFDLAGIPDSFCGFVAAERWARATALSRNCADKPRESSRLCCLWRILSVRQPARVQDTTTGEGIPGPGSRR